MNKQRIAHSFGNASATYEDEAPVQRWSAKALSERVINELNGNIPATCLEIGCGTGFLTSYMLETYAASKWKVTDISPEMLKACQKRVGGDKAQFEILDGELINQNEEYDLIVSNLAFQWFENLPKAISRLHEHLSPNGVLIFSTLGQQTFKEWRNHLKSYGFSVGLHEYPTTSELSTVCPSGDFDHVRIQQPYDCALHFLQALKAIGAQQSQKGYTPLTGGKLRKVLRDFDATQKCSMTYDIIFGTLKKA